MLNTQQKCKAISLFKLHKIKCDLYILLLKKIILFLLLLPCPIEKLWAQENNYRFINFGAKEGLADNFAYTATQDQMGYMWFGTASGLYRYDGHIFKKFKSTIDKPGRAISNILQTVYAATDGTIWLAALNTLQWYNPKKNIFFGPNYDNPVIKKLCDAYILSFTEEDDFVWLTTVNNYFYKFNKKDSSFKSYANLYPASSPTSCLKVLVANNSIWAIHTDGIYQFSKNDQFIAYYPFKEKEITNAIYDKNSNSILLTTYANALVSFDVPTKKFKPLFANNNDLLSNFLFCANIEDEDKYWIGGYPLISIDKKTLSIETIHTKKDSEYDLKTSKIGMLFFDKEKNLWICGYGGLAMMPWQNQQIKTIPLKENKSGVTVEPLSVVSCNNNKFLLLANSNTAGIICYNVENGKTNTIENTFTKNRDSKRINYLIQRSENSIYASDETSLFKVMLTEKKLVPYKLADQNNNPIVNIGRNVTDKSGNTYISSTNNGFYIWEANGKLTHFNKWDVETTSTDRTDNTLVACLIDKEEHVWFTGSEGLYEYIASEKKMIHRAIIASNGIPTLSNANYIAQDDDGHFWITTRNNGLYELYFVNGKEILNNYTQVSNIGLPSDFLIKVKKDLRENILWISFSSGLCRFDPRQKKVISTLKKQNGLAEDNGGYSFNIMPDNKLIQLHYGNMNIIDLNNFKFNNKAPDIFFNSIKVQNIEKLYEINEQNPKLVLAYNENFLQFEFAAISFNNSSQNIYAYKLESVDKDWVYAGNKNSATYAGLTSGNYIFKVKAANNDGVWSKQELILQINIKPIFYKSWWFITLLILLIAALLYMYNRMRIAQVRKEEKLKASFQQQIATTEMKALRAQMNPHFIFNSLNSIQKYILQNDHFAASQYLTKFSRLIRLILDHSNQNNILLSSELDLLKLYIEMESLRFDNKFNYEIIVDKEVNAETIEIPSMLIQPYVENAIWHGLLHKDEKGNLLVHFEKNIENNLVVTITDNGIGREKAAALKSKQVLKKKSYGMQITEDRIDIINRTQLIQATCTIVDLKDEIGNATGTSVILTLPIKPLNN